MIIAEPLGGLCNRIRVINSSFSLARERNEDLLVFLNCNAELNCPFESLFLPIQEFKLINVHSAPSHNQKLFYQENAKSYLTDKEIIENRKNNNGLVSLNYLKSLPSNCYISTCLQFCPTEDYHLFIPTNQLQEKIDKFSAQFGDSCVGVHIRRTDHHWSIKNSDTNTFIKIMQEELSQDSNTIFYLATDDKREEEILRTTFPNKIVSNQQRCLSRNNEQGIQDALLDLYCLANTRKIIGSYWSSFSDTAAKMQNIPLITVRNSIK